ALGTTLDAGFCIDAVGNLTGRKQCEIFNTDQGPQFTTPRFTRPLPDKGIKASIPSGAQVDGRGRALDNIIVGRLWRTVKYGHVYLQDRHTVQETWLGLRGFFHFYNHERLHQPLDYRTPADVYLGKRYGKDETTPFYQPASICVYEILV
ncbi:MAG: integrase core domain-containing protein, partial [Methylovulum sp.]|nr:integrase core domain-containing protein [Methylovulum sp.]